MDKKNYVIIGLLATTLIAAGFNVQPDPNFRCDALGESRYCFAVSSTFKTCYTGVDRTLGKRCSTLWSPIPNVVVEGFEIEGNGKIWTCPSEPMPTEGQPHKCRDKDGNFGYMNFAYGDENQ